MSHYSACQIKFAFDISTESPLEWYEYFGWVDQYAMLKDFLKNNLESDSLSFSEIDTSCAKCTVIFETIIEPELFNTDYQLALTLLEKLSKEPNYNQSPEHFNSMLVFLEEEGVTIYENQPDIDVFYEYNKITQGFKTYQQHLEKIHSNK